MPHQPPTPFLGTPDGVPVPPDRGEATLLDPTQAAPTRPPRLARKRSLKLDKEEVVTDILERYEQDLMDRQDWIKSQLQRHAKYRGWKEGKNDPWPNASDVQLSLMMTDSQRMQDTLHNAVLANRPVMEAKALRPGDAPKCETLDGLLDYQLFVEQHGEEKIADLIDSFVNDGMFVLFQAWVKDVRRYPQAIFVPDVPEGAPAQLHLMVQIRAALPNVEVALPDEKDPFKWTVLGKDESQQDYVADVQFFTDEDDRLVMETTRDMTVYEGPCWFPKPIEDIIVPSRCSNLQPPGPSNPGGAPHVYMIDKVSRDEITRLQKQGYYDLLTKKELTELDAPSGNRGMISEDPQVRKTQKDAFEGRTYGNSDLADKDFTRIIAFERLDVNGDGLEEDVVLWIIKETRHLLRARYLSELHPSHPVKRPFAEARFLSVPGQFYPISMLELLENIHDVVKQTFDQMFDAGTLAVTPFGFYRNTSAMKPETFTFAPGDMIPVQDPSRDVAFPQLMNPQAMSWAMNTISLMLQWGERQSVIGDLQLGRIPYGKSEALRTASGMQAVLQQGDARPERVLRRFFRGLAEAYQQTQELDAAYLSPGKTYRLSGKPDDSTNPFRVIEDPGLARGQFTFDFAASILNTNKAAHAQVMESLAANLINGLTMQLGIVDGQKVYNILKERVKALGEDPGKFLNRPFGPSDMPQITAEQAFVSILNGLSPLGLPAEPLPLHMQLFASFAQTPAYATMSDVQKQLFDQYFTAIQQQVVQQQALVPHADQFAQAFQGSGGGMMGSPPAAEGPATNVQPGELIDKSIPGAGGGAMSAGAQI